MGGQDKRMVTGVPQHFRRSRETALASYDYVDVADGTGVVKFYAGLVSGASAGSVLSRNQFYSQRVQTEQQQTGTGGWAETLEFDFDVEFNTPRNIRGQAIVNIPLGLELNGAGTDITIVPHAALRKWDGTNMTEIVSGAGAIRQHVQAAADLTFRTMDTVYLDVPLTHFKAKESLRLNLKIWMKRDVVDGSDNWIQIGHDPFDRSNDERDNTTFDTYPSTMTAQIPFKLDI